MLLLDGIMYYVHDDTCKTMNMTNQPFPDRCIFSGYIHTGTSHFGMGRYRLEFDIYELVEINVFNHLITNYFSFFFLIYINISISVIFI